MHQPPKVGDEAVVDVEDSAVLVEIIEVIGNKARVRVTKEVPVAGLLKGNVFLWPRGEFVWSSRSLDP